MTIDVVDDLSPVNRYVAQAAQEDFDYDFPIFEEGDLVVVVDDVTQALDTDYTVDGEAEDQGGSITFLTPMTGGEIVTIYRDIPIERTSEYQQNGPWSSRATNTELNRIVMMMQQLESSLGRGLRWPIASGVANTDLELNPISPWLGRYLYINDDGEPEPAEAIETTTLSQSVIADLLFPQTSEESADGVTPSFLHYQYGDPRRRGSSVILTAELVVEFFDFGHAAARVNDTTLTVSGDHTADYPDQSRIRLIDNSGGILHGRVTSSTYAAPDTTIVGSFDGNVPSTIRSLGVDMRSRQTDPPIFGWDMATTQDGARFLNRNDSATAIGRVLIGVGLDSGGSDTALAIVVTHSTRVAGYISGAPAGASVVYHTGEATPLVFGIGDQTKLILPPITSAAQFFGSEEVCRFVSPRADDNGGAYITFYEDDNSTRKGYIGFANGGTNNNLIFAQEEAAPLVLTGGTKHTFTNANKAFVLDVLDEYADDAAAAVGGVEVGELYRTASAIKQRVA